MPRTSPSPAAPGDYAARSADVAIIGGGLIGLASAAALSARGATIALIDEQHPGQASVAAAGMLAPGVEHEVADREEKKSGGEGSAQARARAAHAFAVAARDLYPSYLEALAEFTGIQVPLNRDGILELITDEERAEALPDTHPRGVAWLTRTQLRTLEPAAALVPGALFYPTDGAVDNVVLVRALRSLVESSPEIAILSERATAIDLEGERPVVHFASGRHVAATTLVLAAGAWAPLLDGLPRALPVEPVRGQMFSIAAAPLHHVTYGGDAHAYVVPRTGGRSVIGATMEHVGFTVGTTDDAMRRLEAAAKAIAPTIARARILERWSGLRPITPDLQPIIGRDPVHPALLYACGHSRNGILLGPLTGECIAALASGEEPALDLTPFSISRFDDE